MTIEKRTVWLGAMASLCLLSLGCPPEPKAPSISLVSAAEVEQLLARADSVEPMGEASFEEYPHEGGTTVVCRQPLLLSGGGLGRTGIVHCCTGTCINDPGQPLGNCKTSGCSTGGKTCTALSCTGSCRLDVACKSCDKSMLMMW